MPKPNRMNGYSLTDILVSKASGEFRFRRFGDFSRGDELKSRLERELGVEERRLCDFVNDVIEPLKTQIYSIPGRAVVDEMMAELGYRFDAIRKRYERSIV